MFGVVALLALFLGPSLIFSYQNTSACTGNNYFDTTLMNCNACPTTELLNTTNMVSCYCAAGYFISDHNQIGFEPSCAACNSTSAPSSDGYSCIQCPTTVDPRTGDCLCPDGSAVIDVDQTGTQLTIKQCIACAADAYPGPVTNKSIRACKKCGYGMIYNKANTPWTCDCDTNKGFTKAGDICVLTSDVTSTNADSSVSTITYLLDDGTSFQVQNSDTVNYFFNKAIIGCTKYKDPQSCQSFANLCVMQMYSERHKICALFEQYKSNGTTANDDYQNFLGWHYNYPWLYYLSNRNGWSIIKDTSFTEVISFDSNSIYHFLEFYIFKFTIDGSFKGSELLQTQFQMCPHSINDGLTFRSFGVSFINSCQIDISNLFDRNNNEMLFYDVYLKDRLTGKYIPVPILLSDFIDSTGDTPNSGSDPNYYRFARRFFLYDNLGGLDATNSYINGGNPSVVRYAKSITFKILLQDNKDQKIYTPYIYVDYSAQKSTSANTASINFSTNYEFDTSNFFKTIQILFILTNIAIGFIWLLRLHIWSKYNPSRISPENYTIWVVIRGLIILIETWGYVMFLFLFVVTGYWFIFFKMQKNVYIFMPPIYTWSVNYYPFICVFAIMCSFRIFSMLEMIWRHGNIDIFFVDWENPKSFLKKRDINNVEEQEMVSIWRTLFIANEFNELQPYQYVHTEWTLIFLAFFLKLIIRFPVFKISIFNRGVNWENLAATQPYMTLDVGNVQFNFVLKYFLTSFLFLVIGLVQIVGKRLLNIWIPTSVQEFVDLCSVSNVSIFILDETLHGYYIHGKAPGGTAEVNAEELELALEDESKGNARSRGLEINNPLQSYEIFVPWEMRVEYNGNYQLHLDTEIATKNNMRQRADAFGFSVPKALPPGFDFKKIEDKKRTLSKLLKEYIENVVSEKDKYIQNKTYFQRFFNYPPINLDTLEGSPIFLRDPDLGFQKIFFCGNEFSILLVNISIYEMWDIIFGNTLVAIIMSYVSLKGILYLRNWFGERNISKKTLINSRFLI